MVVSLNEIAATAAKATRGGGHSVGMAEDMGFATRWLCQRALPGAAQLLAALDEFEAVEVVALSDGDGGRRIVVSGRGGPGGAVSALQAGPSLVELSTLGPVRVELLTRPLLVVPFVARAAGRGHGISMRWTAAGDVVVVDGTADGAVAIRGRSWSALTAPVADDVMVRAAADRGADLAVLLGQDDLDAASTQAIAQGCELDGEVWDRLGGLAWRTYVPVSEESRLRGAGAGLTDND